mmetsp:Transcript_33303/g.72666  ORF Transcript_33303/g.72666 Transcript_33303/m.72666 type:complete len:81 (+) Transcript_33303:1429-1671(+)
MKLSLIFAKGVGGGGGGDAPAGDEALYARDNGESAHVPTGSVPELGDRALEKRESVRDARATDRTCESMAALTCKSALKW